MNLILINSRIRYNIWKTCMAERKWCFLKLRISILAVMLSLFITACGSSGGDQIDDIFGTGNDVPLLTSIAAQNVSQTDLLTLDVNNIRDGEPGSDAGMSYSCFYDITVDNRVDETQLCTSIPGATVSFDATTGTLGLTSATALGSFELKIVGTNSDGRGQIIFPIGIRLKFNGINSITAITGTGATINWTPNPQAQSYQLSRLNSLTGLYEVFQIVSGAMTSGATISGLLPNTGYSLRVNALDLFGNSDGNTVARSFTTTTLTRLSMSPLSSSVSAGTPLPIRVTAFNDDGSPQTIGGLVLNPLIQSGTSSGFFSVVTDNDDGTYDFTFTPTVVGTAVEIEVTMALSYFLNNTANVIVSPGPASSVSSIISISSNSVISNSAVTVSALVRDVYNNIIPTATVTFAASGGTSTGTFSVVSNLGSGNYSASFTGIVAGTARTLQMVVDGVTLTPSTTVQVLPGPASSTTSSLVVSSSVIASGATSLVTATIRDINNNPLASAVLVAINKTGGTSTGNFTALVNAGGGVYTTNYEGLVAGSSQTITVAVDGVTLALSQTIQVVPGAVNIGNSSLAVSSPTLNSGNFVTATATLKDLNNNPIDTGVVVSFTKTGGTSTGTFGSVSNVGNGVYTIRYTGVVAGTAQSIAVLADALPTGIAPVSVTVSPGSADPSTSSISTNLATISSGGTATVTATIRDLNSNPISTGILVTFSKTGGTSTGNFSSVTNLGSGQYAINYQGVVAGSAQTIGVIVDGSALGPITSITVTPGAPSVLLSTLTVSSATVIAGSSVLVTAVIRDANSNPISTGITVAFDKSGGTSTGNFSAVSNNGNGEYTVTYTGITAGTAQTLQSNVDFLPFGPTQSLQVLVGAPNAANCVLSIVSSPLASSSVATISALVRDSYNNPITSEYTITFDAIGGSSTGTLSATSNLGSGNFSATYTGVVAGSAQTVRVLADATPITGLTAPLQVVPGSVNATNSTFSITPSSVQSGTDATLAMNLRDSNNNAITSGLTITFNKTAAVSDGTIGAVSNLGSGNYSAIYTGTVQGAAQTITLVVNAVVTTMAVTATVTAGPPTQMVISGPTNPVNSIDCIGPYSAVLRDASNNITSSNTLFTMAFSSAPAPAWTGTLFSDSACTASITNLSFAVAATTQTFYYKSYTPQSFLLTLTPSLGSIAANSTTITNSAVLSWMGSGTQFTFNGSGASTVQDDSTGFANPYDIAIDGNEMYVLDHTAHRIVKINISTNTIIGWIGTVGGLEGISSYDATGTCQALAIGAFTTKWCLGGRSLLSASQLLINPRYVTFDATYLYVTINGSRILRFEKATGAYQGWFGRIGTVPTSPGACSAAAIGAVTPTWCFGGAAQAATLANAQDGHFRDPQAIIHYGGYLYVSDSTLHRIQRINVNGTPEGWIGMVGTVAPPAGGQLGTCTPLPVTGDATPGWCAGGNPALSNRYNLAVSPVELLAPNEGFNSPFGLTTDGTYLYVGDGNARIVRNNLATGAFAGYLGNSPARPTPANNATPAVNAATRYTTTWSTGGVTFPNQGISGFHPTIRAMVNDGTFIYFADDYHRVGRVSLSNGQSYFNIGRVTSTPTGGYVGCSSTPVGGITPGWCFGANMSSVSNVNGAFFNPFALAISSSLPYKLYVSDHNNFRIQKFDYTTGTFESWLGGQPFDNNRWTRTIPVGAAAARTGVGDYSLGEVTTNFVGMGGFGDNMFMTDWAFHRVKKFNKVEGLFGGYVGWIGTLPPTGPAGCVGFTSGLTPTWCTGGGRTAGGGGILQFNQPSAITADALYAYVSNSANNRIDRVRISDGLYMGWIGRVATTPTDGFSVSCTSAGAGTYTPDWCIGGAANATTAMGSFNYPRAMTYDSDGNLYIVDNYPRLLRVNATTGQTTGITGPVAAPSTCASITANVASGWCTSATAVGASAGYGRLSTSFGVATNSTHIFVADTANHRVDRFNKSTGAAEGFFGRLNTNAGLDVSVTGGLCNGLTGFPRSVPGWCFGTSLGVGMAPISGTGNGDFFSPSGVWADDNFIYVTDSNNHRVVKLNATTGAFVGWKGMIGTTAGMAGACLTAGAGAVTPDWCVGGTATNSRLMGGFDYPTGIWGDSNYIYVYDTRNNRTVTVPK